MLYIQHTYLTDYTEFFLIFFKVTTSFLRYARVQVSIGKENVSIITLLKQKSEASREVK